MFSDISVSLYLNLYFPRVVSLSPHAKIADKMPIRPASSARPSTQQRQSPGAAPGGIWDVTVSMREWSSKQRNWAIVVCVAIMVPLSILFGAHLGQIFTQTDTTNYLSIAAGEGQRAMLPFASRQLGPLIVRGLTHLLHVSVQTGFLIEGVLSLVFFMSGVLYLLVRSGAPRIMLPAVVGLLLWSQQFNALVMPDLFYAALLCGFLLFLYRQNLLAAALMMFPLALARESTLLTLACFLIAGWRRLQIREVVAAFVAAIAGMLTVGRLAANALPNQEHISPALYLAGKAPWNFLKNILGLVMSSNVYRACEVPRWTVALHIGPLRQIGFCRFDFLRPVEMIACGLASFGLLFLLLIKVRSVRVTTEPRQNMLLRFCVVYGIISFVLAPLLGESFTRLFDYSWPLFLVALPILLGAAPTLFSSARAALAFLVMHLLLAWSIIMLPSMLVIGVGAIFCLLGWRLLRQPAGPNKFAVT